MSLFVQITVDNFKRKIEGGKKAHFQPRTKVKLIKFVPRLLSNLEKLPHLEVK